MLRRVCLTLMAGALLALAVGCEGKGPSVPPSPSATATPTPTSSTLIPVEASVGLTQEGGYLVEVDTGRIWRLQGAWGGIWSPDGKTLLVPGCCTGEGGLDLIDVPAGRVTRIYQGDVQAAAWSPDGSQIAFQPATDKGLYVVNKDGSGLRRVGGFRGWRISWSPSGKHIVFEADQTQYILDVSTGQQEQLGTFYDFAWSPNGRSLALSGESGLYILDPDSGERQQLATGFSGGRLIWSPDGSRLLVPYGERVTPRFGPYAGTPEAGAPLYHVFDAGGAGEPVSLPPLRFPAWSPDGTELAFESEGCVTGEWDIYLLDIPGGEPRRLTNTPDAFKEGPAWSPDGSSIALVTFGELTLLDLDTGESRRLAYAEDGQGFHLHGGTWTGLSAWSADGRFLQFNFGGGHGVCD